MPEWLKGTGCKPVGYAYLGSKPNAPTIYPLSLCGSGVEHFLGKEEVTGSNPVTGSIDTKVDCIVNFMQVKWMRNKECKVILR